MSFVKFLNNMKKHLMGPKASSEDTPIQPEQNLSDLTVADLKTMAKSRGLKGYSKLKKADLVNLLS